MKEGWRESTIGESCQIRPPKKEVRERLANDSEVSFIPMGDLGVRQRSTTAKETRVLGDVYKGYTYFADGDVLLAKITPCFENGKLGVARELSNGVGFGSSEFMVLRCAKGLDPSFLLYYLAQDSVIEAGAARMTGAVGHKRVPLEFVEQLPLPLPPPAEQERIVAILDESFEAIATATANTEKQLANAREMFSSALDSICGSLASGSELVVLGQHVDLRNGLNYSRSSSGQEIKVVGVGDFQDRFWAPLKQLETKSIDGKLGEADCLREGDLLFVRSNGNKALIGRCMLLGPTAEPVSHSGFTIRMRLDSPGFSPTYLCWFLKSSRVRRCLVESGGGAQISNLTQGSLAGLVVPRPPRSDQERFVRTASSLRSMGQGLEARFARKLGCLAELKRSILNKAFSGELTAVDRELSDAGV